MKSSLLKILAGLLVFSALACTKSEDKKKDKGNPGIQPTESVTHDRNGYKTSSQYKGPWRPVVNCVSENDPKTTLIFDLWEQTATYTVDKKESLVLNSPRLRGKELGTTRSWGEKWGEEVQSAPWEIEGSMHAKLFLDMHGNGKAQWQVVENGRTPCKWCYGHQVKFTCKEADIPFEQKFVEAACAGDEQFVKSFIEENKNLPVYINQLGVLGETALTCALKNRHSNIVNLLLNKYQSGLDFNAGNLDAQSPLMLDLQSGGTFYREFSANKKLDLNRVDMFDHSFLSYLRFSPEVLNDLISEGKQERLDFRLFFLKDVTSTTPFGLMVQQTNYAQTTIAMVNMLKTIIAIDIERPAVAGATVLEYALDMSNTELTKFFVGLSPKQKVSPLKQPSKMVLMAAETCDSQFMMTIAERTDIDFSIKTSMGENAIDVLRKKACADEEQMTEFLVAQGVVDMADPVAPACRKDILAFRQALSRNPAPQLTNKTAKIFECIWNQPTFLEEVTSKSYLSWNWTVIEDYAIRAIQSKNAALAQIYLQKMKFPNSSSFVAKLKTEITKGNLSIEDYFDALVNYGATGTEDNLKVGLYGHLVFNFIMNEDETRTVRYMQSVQASYWPSLDLATKPEVQAAYLKFYDSLLKVNNECEVTSSLEESIYLFALRNKKAKMMTVIAQEMSRKGVRPTSTSANCKNGGRVMLMNPLNLSIAACSTSAVASLNPGGSTYEGNPGNRVITRSPWDALVGASECSQAQVLEMAAALSRNYAFDYYEGEVSGMGPHAETVRNYLARSYELHQVHTGFLKTPGEYAAYAVKKRESTADFAKEDGRVLGAQQRILVGITSNPTRWSDFTTSTSYAITFKGLKDYVSISYHGYPLKKGSCMLIQGVEGALMMRGSELSIREITVCPNTLRFKFDPTTSEKNLPIRDHVDGKFNFSIEGLEEAAQ